MKSGKIKVHEYEDDVQFEEDMHCSVKQNPMTSCLCDLTDY